MRRLLVLALLMLVFAATASADGVSFAQTVITNVGKPVAGALVTVCAHHTNAPNPCTDLATIYGNVELSGGPIANPTPTDGYGNVLVFLAAGTYDYSVAGKGIATTTYKGITLGGGGGGGGTPGAPDTSIQFNCSSSFCGSANLVWNNTTKKLTAGQVGDFFSVLNGGAIPVNGSGMTADWLTLNPNSFVIAKPFDSLNGLNINLYSGTLGATAASGAQDKAAARWNCGSTNGSRCFILSADSFVDDSDGQNPSGNKQATGIFLTTEAELNNGQSAAIQGDASCVGDPCTAQGFSSTEIAGGVNSFASAAFLKATCGGMGCQANALTLYAGDLELGVGADPGTTGQCMISQGISVVPMWGDCSAIELQVNGTPNTDQALLNLVAGTNVTLTDNGSGSVTIDAASSPLALKVNGTPNASQTVLNLAAGSGTTITDGGAGLVTIAVTGGGGTTPGGSDGQVQYNATGVFGGFTMGGDCTITVPNIVCTKTNGVAFAASATTNTTNASNITSGNMSIARVGSAGLSATSPLAIASTGAMTCTGCAPTPGGSNGQIQYDNAGVFGGFTAGGDCTFSVPNFTCTKTGGVAFAASATTNTTNASNITSGNMSIARVGSAGLSASAPLAIAGTGAMTCTGCITSIAAGTSVLGTSAIASGACATTVSTSATGAATTDVLVVTTNGVDIQTVTGYLPNGSDLTISNWITANTVNTRVCNRTALSITPGAVTLRWMVQRQ